MVDNRTSGYFGIGGAFNFKSGDISGTAAKTADDRQSPGMEYFQQQQQQEEEQQQNPHVDRSAQLNATLSSLAMTNIATILHKQKRKEDLSPQKPHVDKYAVEAVDADKNENKKEDK